MKRRTRPFLFAAMLGLLLAGSAIAADTGHYVLGDTTAQTPGEVRPGLLLMGGGDRNFDALRWFMARAGHGHVVVLRASQGGEIGVEFFHEVSGIESVETFVVHERVDSRHPTMIA